MAIDTVDLKVSLSGLLQYAAMVIIFVLALVAILTMYGMGGVQWDFIAHWLSARSLVTPAFYSTLLNGNLANAILYSNSFYFETLRAPLTGVMMIPFVALGGNGAVPVYFASVLSFLLLSAIYISRKFEIPPLILVLLIFTPYVALFLLLLNGTEIVSMGIMLVAVALLLKNDWKSGIAIGLAGLAKYPNLIFIPLIFLLPRKERYKAFLAAFLVSLPWLLFNTAVYHIPIFSYIISVGAFSGGGTNNGYFPIAVMLQSLWLILPELAPALLILVVAMITNSGKGAAWLKCPWKRLTTLKLDYRYKVILCFLGLGVLAWLLTAIRGSINDLPRLGYLIYGGLALLFAVSIHDLFTKWHVTRLVYVSYVSVLFVIMAAILITWTPYTGYVFRGSSNPTLLAAESAINGSGISKCNMVSNNWVYLIYAGYKAHFPYYYNFTVQHYPIVYFTDLGANNTAVNFANMTKELKYPGLLVAFPKNYTC